MSNYYYKNILLSDLVDNPTSASTSSQFSNAVAPYYNLQTNITNRSNYSIEQLKTNIGNDAKLGYSINEQDISYYCSAAYTSIDSSGTYTVPANANHASIICIGGGGGGAGGARGFQASPSQAKGDENGGGGGGGGAGGYLFYRMFSVTPLSTYQVQIGNAGNAGGQNGDGGNGGTTTVNISSKTFTANGGGGGGNGGSNGPVGPSGTGGTAVNPSDIEIVPSPTATITNTGAGGATTYTGQNRTGNVGGVITLSQTGYIDYTANYGGGGDGGRGSDYGPSSSISPGNAGQKGYCRIYWFNT